MIQEVTNLDKLNSDAPRQKEQAPLRSAVTNFSRFYASLNRMPCHCGREEMKRSIVRQYTWDRTDSLKEMTRAEYDACCDALEQITGYRDEQKKARSLCLKLMQKLGIDTTDWGRINQFCQDPRIAGKPFAKLKNDELDALSVKLRSIERKGGLKQRKVTAPNGHITYMFTLGGRSQLSS